MNQANPAPSERFAKLNEVAALVARLAGTRVRAAADLSAVDDAYDNGSTLARARFDDVAAGAMALASAGVEAVLRGGDVSTAALATLADAIDAEIVRLERLLIS